MTNPDPKPSTFSSYYQATAGRSPRELYRQVVRSFTEPGLAVDLGCGIGNETVDLLNRGWRVLALDAQSEAISLLEARIPPEQRDLLETRVASFEALALPPVDFIWAGLSLPFCPPEYFGNMWSKITAALKPGGRFAGDFFGNRHAWAGRPGMTTHSIEQVKALTGSLTLEYFIEEEGETGTVSDGIQHWHAFALVLRK
jgi:tellurite methyltransferase